MYVIKLLFLGYPQFVNFTSNCQLSPGHIIPTLYKSKLMWIGICISTLTYFGGACTKRRYNLLANNDYINLSNLPPSPGFRCSRACSWGECLSYRWSASEPGPSPGWLRPPQSSPSWSWCRRKTIGSSPAATLRRSPLHRRAAATLRRSPLHRRAGPPPTGTREQQQSGSLVAEILGTPFWILDRSWQIIRWMCTKMCAQLSDYVMYEFYYQTRVIIMDTAMWCHISRGRSKKIMVLYSCQNSTIINYSW